MKSFGKTTNIVTIKTMTENGDPVHFGTVRYTKDSDGYWIGSDGTRLTQKAMEELAERGEKREDQKVEYDKLED